MTRRWWEAVRAYPGLKLVSLLIAVLAWWWVQGQEVDAATVRVGLQWRLPEGLVAVDALPTSAVVEVRGPRGAVRRSQRGQMRIPVDLSDEQEGTLDVHLNSFRVDGVPAGLEIGAIRPETIKARLDQEMVRNVGVQAAWVGEPARGHAVDRVSVTPDVVQVRGPRERFGALDHIQTFPIDVAGWRESQRVDVELELPRGVELVSEWEGSAQVEIVNLLTTLTLPDVPVRLWNHGERWRPDEGSSTVSVTLRGPTSLLRQLSTERIVAWVELPDDPRGSRLVAAFEAGSPPRLELGLPRDGRIEVVEPPASVTLVPR